MGQWPVVLCTGSLVFGTNCDQIHSAVCCAPSEPVQAEAVELPHTAWLKWPETGLVFEPESGTSQECNAWVGWFQPGCLDSRSRSSSVDRRDYRYLISLYLLINSPGSSAHCYPVSSADRRHFLQQIPQPVNLCLGRKLQANNS